MNEPNDAPAAPSDEAAPTADGRAYEAPTLVLLGALRDLTATGSFFGDT